MAKRTRKQKFDIMEFARINGIALQSLADGTWRASANGRSVYSPEAPHALTTLLRRYRGSLVWSDTLLSPRAAMELIRSTSTVVAPDSPTPPPPAESGDEPLAAADAPSPAPKDEDGEV